MDSKQPQHPHGKQMYSTETRRTAEEWITKREARIAAAKILGVSADKGETNMKADKRMTDEQWRAKYGDQPRRRRSVRGQTPLAYGRQSGDVKQVLTVLRRGDVFTAKMVWEMFDSSTITDWSNAYGSHRECIQTVKNVLTSLTRGEVKGPRVVREDSNTFVLNPEGDYDRTPIAAYPAHDLMASADAVSRLGMAQEAEASVALDGETQSFEVTEEEEEQPTVTLQEHRDHIMSVSGLQHVGFGLSNEPLFMNEDGVVGTLALIPLSS